LRRFFRPPARLFRLGRNRTASYLACAGIVCRPGRSGSPCGSSPSRSRLRSEVGALALKA
jgi:hypothetical protein